MQGPDQPSGVLFTSGELAQRLGAELRGPGDLPLVGLETLSAARAGTLSFVRHAKNWDEWRRSACSAALVSRRAIDAAGPGELPPNRAILLVPDADEALIAVLTWLAPRGDLPAGSGAHPTATVSPDAALGAGVSVGPGASIDAGVVLGDHTAIGPGAVIGADVRIGKACTLHANVVVQARCVIGDHVIIHPGAVIGADGFGYLPDPRGGLPRKVPHIGSVVIEDHVEIGANSCIDRGKFGATRIGMGTKIDNLVQIGHNCIIGRGCIICGMCGIAGSVTLGDGVMLGGDVGVADNVSIGAGAKLAAKSGVMCDIPPGETWGGYPAQEGKHMMRVMAAQNRLPELVAEMRRLFKSQG